MKKWLCSIDFPINSPTPTPTKVSLTGVAINHDGRAATITAPNGTAQQRVLRSALAERQTQGEDVTMIECHGTGATGSLGSLGSLTMNSGGIAINNGYKL